eukprot:991832-Lingulodinium_polyedra.AAC.1
MVMVIVMMVMVVMVLVMVWVCSGRVRPAATRRRGGRLSRPRPRRPRGQAGPPPSRCRVPEGG